MVIVTALITTLIFPVLQITVDIIWLGTVQAFIKRMVITIMLLLFAASETINIEC